MKEYIQNVLKIKKAYSIPNASDPSLFEPSRSKETVLSHLKDKFLVFWMGSANTPWQGIELILEIAQKMERIDPRVIFVLVAGESLWEFPVRPNLLILKQVPYTNLPHYLASADLCLCLYKEYDWLEYGFYGSALKLFDYMAAAKPVIASRMGQVADVLNDEVNGLLVENDSELIIDKIQELKGDREKRTALGAKARADVINYYNWDRVAEETESVLLNVSS
jgi:glycosyltransferase involved in cell wall biosynthesis